jgi:hypothetical protein
MLRILGDENVQRRSHDAHALTGAKEHASRTLCSQLVTPHVLWVHDGAGAAQLQLTGISQSDSEPRAFDALAGMFKHV